MKIAPFSVRTPFMREVSEGKNTSEIAFPHVKFLQSVAEGVNSSLQTVAKIPATSTATGQPGEVAFDANWLYLCVAHNVWRRIPLGAF